MTKSSIMIWIFYLLTAFWAVGQVFAPYHGGIHYLATLAIGLAPTMWLLRDLKRRGHFFPHVFQSILLVWWPIALPAYVLATRKWRGLLLVLMHSILTLVLNVGLFYATIYMLWGPDAFR